MTIACKTTPEQKEFIWKTYRQLLRGDGSMYGKISNSEGYPNTTISHIDDTIAQTKRNPSDYDADRYFVWVDFDDFKKICMNSLIKKRKIKL